MDLRLNDFELACQEFRRVGTARPGGRVLPQAAFLAGCAFFGRDFPFPFCFAPVRSRLFCKTETRSMTFVGLGAFLGFSSISFPPASTFSSITSMSAPR